MSSRTYTTRRQGIVNALAEKLKTIDGTGEFFTDLGENVVGRLLFWDEVSEFPAVHINAGSETREYQGGGYKDRFLSVTLRCYVNEENAANALDELLEDVETVIETNSRLSYTGKRGDTHTTQQISVITIDTDEGVLEPLGIGEMLLEVRY
tara:strand:+ start:331 stop:783 length:453 start_codon:yes stop_codon:yes gene_type:complete